MTSYEKRSLIVIALFGAVFILLLGFAAGSVLFPVRLRAWNYPSSWDSAIFYGENWRMTTCSSYRPCPTDIERGRT